MSVRIRLARGGTKKRPFYQIVATDSRDPRDGRFLEKLGTYNPILPSDRPERVVLREERLRYWLGVGAQPSDRVARFLDSAGITQNATAGGAPASGPRRSRPRRPRRKPRPQPRRRLPEVRRRPRAQLRLNRKQPLHPRAARRSRCRRAKPRAPVRAGARGRRDSRGRTSQARRRRELSCAELPVMAQRQRDRDWVCVAVVAGAHGLRGALKLRCFTERAEDVAAYGPVFDRNGNRLFELQVVGPAPGGVLARADRIEDRNAAEALRGIELFVPAPPCPICGLTSSTIPTSRAWRRSIPTVRASASCKASTIWRWRCRRSSGRRRPTDQPAVHPATVPRIDLERRRLVVEAPEELVPEAVP